MANIGKVIKDEIQRLSRKQAKAELGATRRAATQHRSDIATLKRELGEMRRRLSNLEKRAGVSRGDEASPALPQGAAGAGSGASASITLHSGPHKGKYAFAPSEACVLAAFGKEPEVLSCRRLLVDELDLDLAFVGLDGGVPAAGALRS